MEDQGIKELTSKCKSIKIIPSLEEILKDMGFEVKLDTEASLWLHQLKATWKTWKKNVAVKSHVDAFFRARPDAFRVALIFAINCDEFKDCKPKSLPFFIIETLLKFSQPNQMYPDEDIKIPAFHSAMYQRNQHFFTLMVKTYQLYSIKEYVIPIVNEMTMNDNCRQALQIVIAMDMSLDIPVENLLFPIILQDKANMLDEYLTRFPDQVKPLLAYLDKLLNRDFKTLDFVQNYAEKYKICQVKFDKMHYKPLGKLVARLCNKFNVPIETCENLAKNRTISGLRYLIYQKYVEHNISISVWDDLVRDSLKVHPLSAPVFIDMLVDYDINEALKWARYLNLPNDKLPLAVRTSLSTQSTLKQVEEDENWDADNGSQEHLYHKSTLTRDQIIIIDSEDKFFNTINVELIKEQVVSMDCEWKPSFGAKQSQVAIIQIGTNDKVYIVDCILLNKRDNISLWQSFLKVFLENPEIIKLGFGFEQDLRELKTSIVGLSNLKAEGYGLLDLNILWKILLNHKLSLPGSSEGGSSLSSVVQSCFGKPLEKSEQCSNWELRPLRESQIKYAALDAHILLQIYYFLKNKCREQGIHFEEICNNIMLENKKTTKKPKVVDRINKSFLQVFSKKASEMKLLVEPTLSNLMSYLRYCGMDTSVVPSPIMLWHDVINLAISEDRYIIIVKPKISPTANFPQSSILSVGKQTVIEQLFNVINTYKVNIEQSDILSICLYCNTKDLKMLNPVDVQKICNDYITTKTSRTYANVAKDDYSEDDDYSNFISDDDDDGDMPRYPPAITNYNPTVNNCITSKGVAIEISDPNLLLSSKSSAILCESCGKLYFKNDDLLKSVSDTVFKVINMTHKLE